MVDAFLLETLKGYALYTTHISPLNTLHCSYINHGASRQCPYFAYHQTFLYYSDNTLNHSQSQIH